MNVVYESQDLGGLATMGAVRPIQGSEGHRDSTERERERGGRWGSHQWRHLKMELRRWSHDDTQ
jgi:hypothetical protein